MFSQFTPEEDIGQAIGKVKAARHGRIVNKVEQSKF
jgi:hypothetical protein